MGKTYIRTPAGFPMRKHTQFYTEKESINRFLEPCHVRQSCEVYFFRSRVRTHAIERAVSYAYLEPKAMYNLQPLGLINLLEDTQNQSDWV